MDTEKILSTVDPDEITVDVSRELGLFYVELRDENDKPIDSEFEETVHMLSVDGPIRIIIDTENKSKLMHSEDGKYHVEDWKYPNADKLDEVCKNAHHITITYLDRYGNPYCADEYGDLSFVKVCDMISYSQGKTKCLEFGYKTIKHITDIKAEEKK